MRAVQSTVCQCGHEKAIHLYQHMGCYSCQCRKFVLPASNVCPICFEEYETKAELDAHLKAYLDRERRFRDL